MKRWLIGGIVVVLVLVVGGPYVYIHFIEGKAPAPLALSQTPTTVAGSTDQATGAPSTSSSTVDGKWKVAGGSVAGYRIKETLFGQSNTAVGRTSTITGSITIAGAQVTAGQFSVDMTTVKSDPASVTASSRAGSWTASSFPTATFTLTQPISLSSVPPDGTTVIGHRDRQAHAARHDQDRDLPRPGQAERVDDLGERDDPGRRSPTTG